MPCADCRMRRVAVDLLDVFEYGAGESPLLRERSTSEWFRANRFTYWYYHDDDFETVEEMIRAHLPDQVFLWDFVINNRTILWTSPPSMMRSTDTIRIRVSLRRAADSSLDRRL